MSPEPVSAPVDSDSFRRLMARWATGVSVVTARDGAVDAGLTVNAFLSVSLAPPSVLVSLTSDADTTPVIERTGLFAVNFLAARQRDLSQRFARADPPAKKFQDLPVHRGLTGVALLDGTLGSLECHVVSSAPAFDHILFVGEVVHQELGEDGPPLLYFRSSYAGVDLGPRRSRGKRSQPPAPPL